MVQANQPEAEAGKGNGKDQALHIPPGSPGADTVQETECQGTSKCEERDTGDAEEEMHYSPSSSARRRAISSSSPPPRAAACPTRSPSTPPRASPANFTNPSSHL